MKRSPPQFDVLDEDFDDFEIRGSLNCNPVRHGQDEYRCTTCGKVWDTHEPKPECERD